MLIQHLNKPAHMCPLEVMRQIDRQCYRRHSVLCGARLISYLNRKSQIPDANAVDCNLPVIRLILCIHEIGQMLSLHSCASEDCSYRPPNGS